MVRCPPSVTVDQMSPAFTALGQSEVFLWGQGPASPAPHAVETGANFKMVLLESYLQSVKSSLLLLVVVPLQLAGVSPPRGWREEPQHINLF